MGDAETCHRPISPATCRPASWAEFRKLNHRLQKTKQIDSLECIREAYRVCARELPHEAAVAVLVRFGRALKWLPAERQTGRRIRAYFAGVAPASPPSDPADQEIPEAEQRAVVAKLVADLIRAEAQLESPLELLGRVQGHWGRKTVLEKCGVAQSTLQNWVKDPQSVRPGTDAKIRSGLRKLAAKIPAE